MAILPKDYHDPIVDCKGREQDACSCEQHQNQILPNRESCQYPECVKIPTIPEKRNVKEDGKQEKVEMQDGRNNSGN